jgi:K+-transporting ATPase KdpF subunit
MWLNDNFEKKEQFPEEHMDFMIAGFIGVMVLVYLTYALFNPEKF